MTMAARWRWLGDGLHDDGFMNLLVGVQAAMWTRSSWIRSWRLAEALRDCGRATGSGGSSATGGILEQESQVPPVTPLPKRRATSWTSRCP